jgi:hypothetical protein
MLLLLLILLALLRIACIRNQLSHTKLLSPTYIHSLILWLDRNMQSKQPGLEHDILLS